MTAPLAFYAPLKPPDHPTPSGDRRMARALVQALARAGQSVELASRLRSYDRSGDPFRQRRIEALGGRLATRLLRRYRARSPAARPRAWLTYHPYHKSPDWLGPVVADDLGIPYLLVEASFAPKQAGGPFARGHAASERAIRRADVALALTARDAECLAPLILPPAELHRLPPFLDPGPYQAAASGRGRHRSVLSTRFGLDPAVPWLLAVAMMRADVKRDSYLLLADALGRLGERSWQLLVVGDGPARCEIEAALSRLGPARVAFAGAVPETSLATYYAAADLLVWPAVREAYGLAMLEAQAAGLPVIAGREGGVAEVVQDGITGVLCAPRDPAGFAQATLGLLADGERRRSMGAAAARFVLRERSLEQAAATLAAALEAAGAIRAARS
jgi:glycosyltransferase involved in cell wall biosynthesis